MPTTPESLDKLTEKAQREKEVLPGWTKERQGGSKVYRNEKGTVVHFNPATKTNPDGGYTYSRETGKRVR